jgi:hypothetical protein
MDGSWNAMKSNFGFILSRVMLRPGQYGDLSTGEAEGQLQKSQDECNKLAPWVLCPSSVHFTSIQIQ